MATLHFISVVDVNISWLISLTAVGAQWIQALVFVAAAVVVL